MKCPRCGEETSPGKTCEGCGEVLPVRKEVEVEYKEFRISELLDIKMSERAGADRSQTGDEHSGRRDTEPPTVSPAKTKAARRKSLIVIMTVVVFVVAAIVGLYFSGLLEVF
ncbi:MAG: hypothetical protein P8013_12640 [Candidatus Sulfobium sp.]|jgi:hypothetical protein